MSFVSKQWFGPILLASAALCLLLVDLQSELLWGLAVLALAVAGWGTVSQSRWYVALPTIFVASILAFQLSTLSDGVAASASVVLFLFGLATTLWLLPSDRSLLVGSSLSDVVIAYAGALGLVELFLILRYWPTNFPSRALVLTSAAFLLFEFLDRHRHGIGFHSILGSVGMVILAVVAIVLTGDWQTF